MAHALSSAAKLKKKVKLSSAELVTIAVTWILSQ
jgi:hypothetical protein